MRSEMTCLSRLMQLPRRACATWPDGDARLPIASRCASLALGNASSAAAAMTSRSRVARAPAASTLALARFNASMISASRCRVGDNRSEANRSEATTFKFGLKIPPPWAPRQRSVPRRRSLALRLALYVALKMPLSRRTASHMIYSVDIIIYFHYERAALHRLLPANRSTLPLDRYIRLGVRKWSRPNGRGRRDAPPYVVYVVMSYWRTARLWRFNKRQPKCGG